jgi:hypothetical protein
MAHDKTPERNSLIFFYTVLSVVTLIALGFMFQSYFSLETERVVTRHVRQAPAVERQKLEAEQRDRLARGPVSIDQAMQQVARNRQQPGIEPAASRDLAPLEGWNQARVFAPVPAAFIPRGVPEPAAAEGAEDEGADVEEAPIEVAPEGATGDTAASPAGLEE